MEGSLGCLLVGWPAICVCSDGVTLTKSAVTDAIVPTSCDSDCGYSGKRTAWNKLLQQKRFFWSQTSSELEVWIYLVLLNCYMIVTVSKIQIIALSPDATSSNCSIVALLAVLFCYCLRHHLQGIHGQNFLCGISYRGGCSKGSHILLLLLAPFQRTSDQGRCLSPVGEQDTATNQRWQRTLIH